MYYLRNYFLPILLSAFLFSNCAYGPPPDSIQKNESNLTPGMISTTLEEGKSSKKDVMEVFGPPDLITKEDGVELWGYDRISRETAYRSFGIGVLGGGIPGGAALLGGGISAKQGSTNQTTKTVFLLVYFKNDIVVEYKLSTTKF